MDVGFELDDGRKFSGRIGRITKTELGLEDDLRFFHGNLKLEFPGGGVQELAPILCGPDETALIVHHHIRQILHVANVRSWEQLPRQQVVALYEGAEYTSPSIIAGLASLDGHRIYILADAMAEVDRLMAQMQEDATSA